MLFDQALHDRHKAFVILFDQLIRQKTSSALLAFFSVNWIAILLSSPGRFNSFLFLFLFEVVTVLVMLQTTSDIQSAGGGMVCSSI